MSNGQMTEATANVSQPMPRQITARDLYVIELSKFAVQQAFNKLPPNFRQAYYSLSSRRIKHFMNPEGEPPLNNDEISWLAKIFDYLSRGYESALCYNNTETSQNIMIKRSPALVQHLGLDLNLLQTSVEVYQSTIVHAISVKLEDPPNTAQNAVSNALGFLKEPRSLPYAIPSITVKLFLESLDPPVPFQFMSQFYQQLQIYNYDPSQVHVTPTRVSPTSVPVRQVRTAPQRSNAMALAVTPATPDPQGVGYAAHGRSNRTPRSVRGIVDDDDDDDEWVPYPRRRRVSTSIQGGFYRDAYSVSTSPGVAQPTGYQAGAADAGAYSMVFTRPHSQRAAARRASGRFSHALFEGSESNESDGADFLGSSELSEEELENQKKVLTFKDVGVELHVAELRGVGGQWLCRTGPDGLIKYLPLPGHISPSEKLKDEAAQPAATAAAAAESSASEKAAAQSEVKAEAGAAPKAEGAPQEPVPRKISPTEPAQPKAEPEPAAVPSVSAPKIEPVASKEKPKSEDTLLLENLGYVPPAALPPPYPLSHANDTDRKIEAILDVKWVDVSEVHNFRPSWLIEPPPPLPFPPYGWDPEARAYAETEMDPRSASEPSLLPQFSPSKDFEKPPTDFLPTIMANHTSRCARLGILRSRMKEREQEIRSNQRTLESACERVMLNEGATRDSEVWDVRELSYELVQPSTLEEPREQSQADESGGSRAPDETQEAPSPPEAPESEGRSELEEAPEEQVNLDTLQLRLRIPLVLPPDGVDLDEDTDKVRAVLVKWRGVSHLHSTWELERNLRHLSTYRRVKNQLAQADRTDEVISDYEQKIVSAKQSLQEALRETGSAMVSETDVSEDKNEASDAVPKVPKSDLPEAENLATLEENLELLQVRNETLKLKTAQYCLPERVLAQRVNRPAQPIAGISGIQYLVKWAGQPYDCSTWEYLEDVRELIVGTWGTKLARIASNTASRIGSEADTDEPSEPSDRASFLSNTSAAVMASAFFESEGISAQKNLLEEYNTRERYMGEILKRNYLPPGCERPPFRELKAQPSYIGKSLKEAEAAEKANAAPAPATAFKPPIVPDAAAAEPAEADKKAEVGAAPGPHGDTSDENILRDYQLHGINLMLKKWCAGDNTILADEMGLGKTIQTIGLISVLYHKYLVRGPFLVIVPLSTIGSGWVPEFQKWAPDLNVVVYTGSKKSRDLIRQYEFTSRVTLGGQNIEVHKFHVLLTNPELAARCLDEINRFQWRLLVIDEAHSLKNSRSQRYRKLMTVRTESKILITGTPAQNTLSELWALLHFLHPDRFASLRAWEDRYGNPENPTQVEEIIKIIQPYFIRRTKKDVEKDLPPKIERILRVGTSALQKRYYKWILSKNYEQLAKGSRGSKVSLLNIVAQLKKVCNHPYLFPFIRENDIPPLMESRMRVEDMLELMVKASAKLRLLDMLLERLKRTGHRVLIFSQMVSMLDLLAEYLEMKGWLYQRLDGSTCAEARIEGMRHFNSPGSRDFVYLLSTKAGGLGINLATADTVIIYDSDWNPQNDIQAQARAHRIGQRNAVKVYRLITARTYEQEMFHRASLKLGLGKAVIHGISKKEEKMPKEELNNLIKRGAYFLMEDDAVGAERARKFSEESITSILGRAAVIDVGGAPGASKAQRLLSRASFSFGGDDINISDPSFWDKCLPASAEQALIKSMAPRQRRMTVAYSGNISAQDEPAEEPAAKAPASDDVRLKGTKWTKRELFSIFSAVRRFGLGKWVQVARGAGIRVQDLPMVREALAVRRDLPIGEDPERLPPEPFVTPTGVYHTLEDLVRAAFALLGLCILEADDAGKLGKTSPEEMQRTLYRLETESASRFCGAPLLPVRDDAEVAAVFECPPPFLQLRDKLSSQANTTLKRVPDLTVAAITCLHAGVIHIDPESGPFGIEVPTRPAEQHGTRSGHRSSRRGGRTSGQRRSTRIRHTAGSDAHGSEAENSSDSSDEAREPDVPFPIFDSLLVRAKLPAHWWTPTDDVDLLAFVVSVSGLDKAIISEQNWCPGDAAEASEADVSADGEYVARRASSLLTSVVRECSRRVFENDWPQADTVTASAARAGEDAAQAKPPSSREEEMADEEKLPSRAPRAPVKIVSRRRAAPRQPQRAEEEPAPLKKLDARPPAARERARASSGPLPSRKDVQALLSVLKKFGLVRVADMPVLKAARWRSAHFSGGGSVSECLRDARAQPLPREMPKPALGVYELLSPLAARGASLEAVDAGPENMRRLAEDLQPCTLPPNLPPHFSAFLVPLLLGVFAVAGEHDFAAVLEMPGADGRLVRFLRSVVNDTLARDVARRLAHFELIRARALPLVLKANPKQLLKPMPRGHTAHTPADTLTARWTPALDRGLVLGVAVHGVNFDSLWMDPALPFVRASRQVLAAGGKMPRAARAKECLRARPASKWLWRHVVSFASQETTRRKRTSTQSVRRVGVQAVHEPARKIAPAEAPPKIDTSSFDF
eukprot:gnl/Chilomastix_cuspidata/369.p1 GENE.gnl/Chilomastix_cuspidata/369~~gnl/Chilomastix_cuspidata/369.p1  ORF type:complete len:2479 (+),score=1000.07 gnl/Chilomastix_cuspidata/369:1910-9346(+)